MKKILVICLVLLTPLFLSAQNQPRVAIIPFEPIGVSETDARAVSALFETGLVNTGAFNVIEQNKIEEILDAQAFSLSGCTDDACAIEIGELLSAEQIVLGSMSQIGGTYVLTAKLIDVKLGKNLQAADIQAMSLSEMPEKSKTLAYAIAGLTYTSGGSVQIADAFGEVFISTEPSGCDIYINGVQKGKSPDVFSRIPVGKVMVEARSGNMYASREVNIVEGMQELELSLKIKQGNLFIKSSESGVNVSLNGRDLGSLGSGLFKDLSVGTAKLELSGGGFYYSEEVNITEGDTTKVDAYPYAVGIFEYILPSGVSGTLKGSGGALHRFSRNGRIVNLQTGEYSYSLSGRDYKTSEGSVRIVKGRTASLSPQLEHTEAYKENEQREIWTKRFNELQTEAESVKTSFDDKAAVKSFITDLEILTGEIDNSQYKDENILTSVVNLKNNTEEEYRQYRIESLKNELDELHASKEKAESSKKTKKIISIAALSTGGAALAVMGMGIILANLAYADYQTSTITPETSEYRSQVELWDTVSLAAGIAGGVASAAGLIFGFIGESPGDYDEGIARVSAELAKLEGGME